MDNPLDLLLAAIGGQACWQISLWHSLILAAARVPGAGELISGDLNHNQDCGGIRGINPFDDQAGKTRGERKQVRRSG